MPSLPGALQAPGTLTVPEGRGGEGKTLDDALAAELQNWFRLWVAEGFFPSIA